MTWINRCHIGDCRDTLRRMAADGVRVQMCVTSPPYWGLRDYRVEGQLGLEATSEEYIANMVGVFRLVREVLADDATLWVNMGGGFKNKQLDGMPWRLAFALQADDWYLRSDIIWAKSNPMPESVTDRPTKSHEYLFLLSKQASYYYDADAVREDAQYGRGSSFRAPRYENNNAHDNGRLLDKRTSAHSFEGGRNLRSVWTIATQPYSEAHFATFPQKLVEPCILAGASERGHCPECGKRWVRITDASYSLPDTRWGTKKEIARERYKESSKTRVGYRPDTVINKSVNTIGWQADCACSANHAPDVVLDPFFGSGTVGQVAENLGRSWIGLELNPEYVKMSEKRTAQMGMAL